MIIADHGTCISFFLSERSSGKAYMYNIQKRWAVGISLHTQGKIRLVSDNTG